MNEEQKKKTHLISVLLLCLCDTKQKEGKPNTYENIIIYQCINITCSLSIYPFKVLKHKIMVTANMFHIHLVLLKTKTKTEKKNEHFEVVDSHSTLSLLFKRFPSFKVKKMVQKTCCWTKQWESILTEQKKNVEEWTNQSWKENECV